MFKAINRSLALSPLVSVSTAAPVEQPNGERHVEHHESPVEQDCGQNSLAHNMDEVQTETGDGASSAAAMIPVFYAGMMLRGHKGDLVRLFELPPTEVRLERATLVQPTWHTVLLTQPLLSLQRLLGDFHCAMRKRVLLQVNRT